MVVDTYSKQTHVLLQMLILLDITLTCMASHAYLVIEVMAGYWTDEGPHY